MNAQMPKGLMDMLLKYWPIISIVVTGMAYATWHGVAWAMDVNEATGKIDNLSTEVKTISDVQVDVNKLNRDSGVMQEKIKNIKESQQRTEEDVKETKQLVKEAQQESKEQFKEIKLLLQSANQPAPVKAVPVLERSNRPELEYEPAYMPKYSTKRSYRQRPEYRDQDRFNDYRYSREQSPRW